MRWLAVLILSSCAASPPNAVPAATAPIAKPGCPAGTIAVHAGSFALAKTKESVTVAAHCIDRTEITVAAFAACVTKGMCSEPDSYDENLRKWCNWKAAGRDNDPINCVDHAQATAYCAFVSGRLPSEAEWEWSARGYESATTYPWGNDAPGARACWDGPGNTVSEERDGTCPVGSFPSGANPKGVLDLAGNVWEWTASEVNGKAIDKGGGYPNELAWRLSAKDRNEVSKTQRSSTLGFRCVR
jgi:formylglycine-generating enzyme required for sulfatase activity